MEISTDEVLAIVRELFPKEFDIAVLTAANRRQAHRIADLESRLAVGDSDATPLE